MSNAAAITQGKWSTRDVHDTKFNEDKLSIQFRTGRLGKKLNAPYQYRKKSKTFANLQVYSDSL